MSEGKRVSLQSIGPAKKDKKCKSTSTTIRLNLTLPSCNSDTFADFNYNTLILNERKKKEKEKNKEKDEKVNGVNTLDPYASDDDDNLRRIASSFESKYGTPKKKCRRLEDYTELGTGYDENDSFIDNTDAYDEVVPEDQTPELDGFYINKGELIFKRVDGHSSSDQSDSEESDGPQNTKSQKRPLSSESESGSSGSSDDSDDSDDSEDSEEDEDEEGDSEIPKETKSSSKEIKEEKSNGHGSNPAAKKPKLLETSSKKVKNKAISGVFLKKAVSEKEHNEKRLKHESWDPVINDKRPSNVSEKAQSEKHSNFQSDVKQISSIDAAIEAVARGEDSKESGIAESKSRSGSSDEADSDESGKINGQSNGVLRVAPPLPADLPPNVVSVVAALRELSVKNSSLNKTSFFTPEINSLLLKFEKNLRHVSREKKAVIYDHLEFYLPCRKDALIKRCKALLMESVEKAFKEPLSLLKKGIAALMPSAMERYQSMCKKYESLETSEDPTDASKPADKTKTPRRRFPWTDELKSNFLLAVRKRRIYFGTVKQKNESWENHLREFLKSDLLPMWEPGWMKINSLIDIITKMQPDLLQFKPPSLSSSDLMTQTAVCPTKKSLFKAKQAPNDVKMEGSIKKMSSPPGNVAGYSKPLQSLNHETYSNIQQVLPSEGAVKNEIPVSSSRTSSSVSLMHSGTVPTSNQTNALDMLGSEIAESLKTSLANSLLSVTPVLSSSSHSNQNNQQVSSSSVPARKIHGSGVNVINLSSNGMDSCNEVVPKKRMPVSTSVTQSGQHNLSVVQSLNKDLQYLSKPQLTSISNASPTLTTQQSSYHSSTSHNQIKVSSVSAINLKLSGSQAQAQSHPSSKANMAQPLTSSKAQMAQTITSKANMPQTPSSKASMPHPSSGKAMMAQPSSGKPSMPQPKSSKTNVSQPPSSKASVSVSQKSNNHQNMSGNLGTSSYSNQSVISHGMDPGSLGVSSSLTITPVKSSPSNSYYQQAKASGHLTVQSSNSSIVSHGNSNIRSEVIVTPSSSSSTPHIKSTHSNFSASSISSSNNYPNSQSSGINFSTSHSGSVNNIANSRGGGNTYQSSHITGGNGYSSSLSSSDTSLRTHRTMANDPPLPRNHSADSSAYSSRNQVPDKTSYMSSSMWSSSGPVDVPRSPSSSPSSVKSITPSPEKAMVSRKDRILQESRERPGNDPMMPTLSGPYRNNNTPSDANNTTRNPPQSAHNSKRKSLPEISDLDINMAISSAASIRNDTKNSASQEESRQKAQDLAMRGILMSRSNCDGNYDDPWGAAPLKKTVSNKSTKAKRPPSIVEDC